MWPPHAFEPYRFATDNVGALLSIGCGWCGKDNLFHVLFQGGFQVPCRGHATGSFHFDQGPARMSTFLFGFFLEAWCSA